MFNFSEPRVGQKADCTKGHGGTTQDETCALLTHKPENIVSIVDDDDSVREAINRLVRSLGYSAAAFSSAEEFLSSDHVNGTSCLIADVQMPGMSGIELQHHLIQQGHHMPIIFVTAHPEERLRKRAIEAGAVEYLSKPFSCEQLFMCLDAALSPKG